MREILPSTVALKYFVVAAQHLSFTHASIELHVTQAAVSKQIKQLEETLGVTLFHREKQRISLTEAGELYLKSVVKILDDLSGLTHKVRNLGKSIDVINIGILPTLCSRWLIPLLPKLYHEHPEIRLNLHTELHEIDFKKNQYDIAISFNEPTSNDVLRTDIMNESLILVASPKLIKQDRLTLNEVERMPLLTFAARPKLWDDWFAQFDRLPPSPQSGLTFENFQMLIHATISGLGICLIPEFMIKTELKTGSLKQVHSRHLHSKPYYFMAIPNDKLKDEKIIKFKRWLLNEIKNAR